MTLVACGVFGGAGYLYAKKRAEKKYKDSGDEFILIV